MPLNKQSVIGTCLSLGRLLSTFISRRPAMAWNFDHQVGIDWLAKGLRSYAKVNFISYSAPYGANFQFLFVGTLESTPDVVTTDEPLCSGHFDTSNSARYSYRLIRRIFHYVRRLLFFDEKRNQELQQQLLQRSKVARRSQGHWCFRPWQYQQKQADYHLRISKTTSMSDSQFRFESSRVSSRRVWHKYRQLPWIVLKMWRFFILPSRRGRCCEWSF